MYFNSKYVVFNDTNVSGTASTIENETMLFKSSYQFAIDNGNQLTKSFLYHLLDGVFNGNIDDLIIDSRTHMLMRGMWPCIPGWHHDDVPRNTADGQPNYDNPEYKAKHVMCVVDAIDQPTCSLTEMISGRVEVPWPLAEGATVYNVWDSHINASGHQGVSVPSGKLVYFNSDTFHRGMPAKSTGWRWFIRATWNTHQKPENKIRKNANVYMAASASGW